jgi:O-antigen/teichoic acid export membrane protein
MALPGLLREGWPACLAVIMIAARSRIDQVLVGRLAGFDETAVYAIAVRFSELWLVVPATLMASLFPAIVRARESDPDTYRQRLQSLCDALVWMAAAGALVVTAVGPAMLEQLLGVAFVRSGPVMVVLFWSAVWVFFATARTRWLVADGTIMPILVVEGLGLAAAVAANLVLVPAYGALGAAGATLLSAVLANLGAALFSNAVRESLGMFAAAIAAPVRIAASLIRR